MRRAVKVHLIGHEWYEDRSIEHPVARVHFAVYCDTPGLRGNDCNRLYWTVSALEVLRFPDVDDPCALGRFSMELALPSKTDDAALEDMYTDLYGLGF